MLKQIARILSCVIVAACASELEPEASEPVSGQASALYAAPLSLRGVNLSGAEYSLDENGLGTLPGQYIYPDAAFVPGYNGPRYFMQRGMNTFRLPFRWELLQPVRNAALDAGELQRMRTTVRHLLDLGARVILDPHNYARYGTGLAGQTRIVGSPELPATEFADFWARLASEWKDEPKVVFGLMNEPFGMNTETWLDAANAALGAIRAAGAQNLVLVPGNNYTGAASWTSNSYGTPNSVALLNIVDPGNNFAIDVHTYLNGDGSGRSEDCVSASVGSENLQAFTAWLVEHDLRAVLTEFGAGSGEVCLRAIDDVLNHLEQHADHYLGWTYWAGGPWWMGNFPSIEPREYTEVPQMGVLAKHLAAEPVTGTPPAGATLIYAEALANGWDNWSYGLSSATEQAAPALGAQAFALTYGDAYTAFKLAHANGAANETPIANDAFTHLVLHLNPGAQPSAGLAGLHMLLQLGAASSQPVQVSDYAALIADTWTRIRVPISAFNFGSYGAFALVDTQGGVQVAIDAIWLEKEGATAPEPPLTTYQAVSRTLTLPSGTRSFLLATPSEGAPQRLPLVIALHGDGGTPAGLRHDFAIEAEARGAALIAYPKSAERAFTYWTLEGRQAEAAFVKALIATLDTEGLIRTDRVFLAGHSGGAVMSNALACALGASSVRAVGVMAGTLYPLGDFEVIPDGSVSCTLPPAAIVWGSADAEMPLADGVVTRERYRAEFGCAASNTTHPVAPAPCVAYDGCSSALEWCEIPDMGHSIWNQAPQAIWSFFASQM